MLNLSPASAVSFSMEIDVNTSVSDLAGSSTLSTTLIDKSFLKLICDYSVSHSRMCRAVEYKLGASIGTTKVVEAPA